MAAAAWILNRVSTRGFSGQRVDRTTAPADEPGGGVSGPARLQLSSGAHQGVLRVVIAPSGGDTAVSQQGVDLGLASAEGDKQVHRVPRAALFEDVVQERLAGFRIEHTVFLEQREGIRGQDLGPFIAVIACGLST